MNEACLMKMSWSLMTGEHSLWGDVLLGKYGRDDWSQGRISVQPTDSSLWKAIAKSWPNMQLHRYWSIGDGSRVKFWSDKWIDGNTRFSELEINIPEASRHWMVKDVVLPNGEWNFNMIRNMVPNFVIQKMHAIVPPHENQGEDVQLWPGTSMGEFTVAVAYQALTGATTNENDMNWTKIWKIDSIERIKVFVWQLVHDRLLTKARLAKWQIGNALCHYCTQFEETTMHVVRDCTAAVNIWRKLLTSQERGQFFMVDFQQWINLNINNNFGMRFGKDWVAI
jgi:mannosylglycoprotein endo-beta-mannosidase